MVYGIGKRLIVWCCGLGLGLFSGFGQDSGEWKVIPNHHLTFTSKAGTVRVTGFLPFVAPSGSTGVTTLYQGVSRTGTSISYLLTQTTVNEFSGSLTFDLEGEGSSDLSTTTRRNNFCSEQPPTTTVADFNHVDANDLGVWDFLGNPSFSYHVEPTSATGKRGDIIPACDDFSFAMDAVNNESVTITLVNPVNLDAIPVRDLNQASAHPRLAEYAFDPVSFTGSYGYGGGQVDALVYRSDIEFLADIPAQCGGVYDVRYRVRVREGDADAEPIEKVIPHPQGSIRAAPDIEGQVEITGKIFGQRNRWIELIAVEYRETGTGCSGDDCGVVASNSIGSIDWSLPLNPLSPVEDGGRLLFYSDRIDSSIYTPARLEFQNPSPEDIEVIHRSGGSVLRQILTQEYLVDVVTHEDEDAIPEVGFEVRLYPVSAGGAFDEGTGVYPVAGPASLRFVFDDPGGPEPSLRVRDFFAEAAAPTATHVYTVQGSTRRGPWKPMAWSTRGQNPRPSSTTRATARSM